MRRDEWCVVVFKKGFLGDGRRALDGENLKRALKKRDLDGGGPRMEWKKRRDDERWRIGIALCLPCLYVRPKNIAGSFHLTSHRELIAEKKTQPNLRNGTPNVNPAIQERYTGYGYIQERLMTWPNWARAQGLGHSSHSPLNLKKTSGSIAFPGGKQEKKLLFPPENSSEQTEIGGRQFREDGKTQFKFVEGLDPHFDDCDARGSFLKTQQTSGLKDGSFRRNDLSFIPREDSS
ncbi:hypothetical protein TNCV_2623221 [Trichonephila clavipes]|nr:hypothetical protein TNCV_2623221 [Trichonephila clavipes]